MTNPDELTPLCCDQRRRWLRGERMQVEAYLDRHPALLADAEAVLDLIYGEIVLREEQGESPQLDEYVRRFPQFQTQLRFQFEVDQAVKDDSALCLTRKLDEHSSLGENQRFQISPSAGATVAKYEILEELGRGGMGVVYRAVQVDLKRQVALKMILAGASAGAKDQARLLREAEAAARLKHPNIVQIYEVGEQAGCLFLALELVDGVSLEKKFAGQPVPARQAAQLVQTLAAAIHAAHRQGIIHRDLKPANVLLTGVGVPKITDFGLAKMLDAAANQTLTDALMGTPCYMAPEQAAGRAHEIGPATDVYGLGTLLYELLTGRPPFVGASPMETILKVLHDDVVPPSQQSKKTPLDLETICLKCLHKEPQRRYAGANDLADDLRRFLANEPIRARPVTVGERLLKWTQRRRAVAALVVVSVVSVLILAAGLGWHYQEGRAAEQAHRKYQQFLKCRDDALFYGIYGTLFTDANAARNRSATERAAREALDLMGVHIEGGGKPALDPNLTESEKAEVLKGSYQLLLMLAEVTANGSPDQEVADPNRHGREALAILDHAAQLKPPTLAYHRRRARYLSQVGDLAAAQQELARTEPLETKDALAYFLLGQDLFDQSKVEQACVEFQKALAASPDDFWSQFFLAVGHLKLSHPAEAVTCLTKCAEQRTDFIWTYLLRSLAYEQLNAVEKAEADYRTALDLHPNDDARYLLHVDRGRLRVAQKNYTSAMSEFEKAIRLKPNLYNAFLELARTHEKQGRGTEAARQLEQAVRLGAPATVLADHHAERGYDLYRDNKYEEALEACARALNLRPDYPAAHALRGRILMALQRYEPAGLAFDDYMAHGGKHLADIYRERGSARMKLGNYLGAVEDYSDALEQQRDSDLYAHRGWAYFFADASKRALVDFDKALQMNPENADAYVGRGLSRVTLGQYREAIGDAEAALERKPETPEMMHNVACIFSLAVSQAERDGLLPLAARYREQGVDAVRNTLALVPQAERMLFWRDKIVPDKALDAIRACASFKQLAQ